MQLSSKIQSASKSITLKLNEKAKALAESGKHIYNLTAGELTCKPSQGFIEAISTELVFLKSYQYSPVAGFPDLRKKLMSHTSQRRQINFSQGECEFDCVISNGSKHSIYNTLGALIDRGDEVLIMTPYWVSYPEMIRFWGGESKIIPAHPFDGFTPRLSEIPKLITPRTKAIIVNSPNNPAGVHYDKQWMEDFGKMMLDYEDVIIISDEVYSDLYYFDPKPTYFYQFYPELLRRTLIISGISKSLAATGLRIGYCIGSKELIEAVTILQSQTTSGPNALMQRALMEFDLYQIEDFLKPIKIHLRNNAQCLRTALREGNLGNSWYQPTSAFYYMIDFTATPFFASLGDIGEDDQSTFIVEKLLEEKGVALVPGSAFGVPNSARISLVPDEVPFAEAIKIMVDFLTRV